MSGAINVRPMAEEDRDLAFPIYVEAFGGDLADLEVARELPVADRWVVELDGEIVGLLRVLRTGCFLGGRSIPSAEMAAVAIATRVRRRGLGRALLTETLRALREEGVAMSRLYPASMAPYRRIGYEIAGTRVRYEVPLSAVPVLPTSAVAEPFGDDELALAQACYREFATARPGLTDRPDWWWGPRVMSVGDNEILYRYLVRDGDRVRGYVMYTQAIEPGALPEQFAPGDEPARAIATRDLVWLDREALAALLTVAAGHASLLGTRLIWGGAPSEPLATLFGGAQPRVFGRFEWMARLLDVRAAFEARGYPDGVTATVELGVTGDALAGDRGYRIEIADGAAHVSDAAAPTATIDIGALSALFTGWLGARDAAVLGRLQGVDPATLEALDAALRAQGAPWMFDFF